MVTRPPSTPSPPNFQRVPPRYNFSARNRFFFELRKFHPSQYHPRPSRRPQRQHLPQTASLSSHEQLSAGNAPASSSSNPALARTVTSLEAAIPLQCDHTTRSINAPLEPSALSGLLRDSVSVITSLNEQLSRARQVPRPEPVVMTSLVETSSSPSRTHFGTKIQQAPPPRLRDLPSSALTVPSPSQPQRGHLLRPTSQLVALLRPRASFILPIPHRPPTELCSPWPSVPTSPSSWLPYQ